MLVEKRNNWLDVDSIGYKQNMNEGTPKQFIAKTDFGRESYSEALMSIKNKWSMDSENKVINNVLRFFHVPAEELNSDSCLLELMRIFQNEECIEILDLRRGNPVLKPNLIGLGDLKEIIYAISKEYSRRVHSLTYITNKNVYFFINRIYSWVMKIRPSYDEMVKSQKGHSFVLMGHLTPHDLFYAMTLTMLGFNVLVVTSNEQYVQDVFGVPRDLIEFSSVGLSEKRFGIETPAFIASKEARDFFFNEDTNFYLPFQLNGARISSIPLICAEDELAMLFKEKPKYRFGFRYESSDNFIRYPTIFASITTVEKKSNGGNKWASLLAPIASSCKQVRFESSHSTSSSLAEVINYVDLELFDPYDTESLNYSMLTKNEKTVKVVRRDKSVEEVKLTLNNEQLHKHQNHGFHHNFSHSNLSYMGHYSSSNTFDKAEDEKRKMKSLVFVFNEFNEIQWETIERQGHWHFYNSLNEKSKAIFREKVQELFKMPQFFKYVHEKKRMIHVLYHLLTLPDYINVELERFDYANESPGIIYEMGKSSKIASGVFYRLMLINLIGFDVLILSNKEIDNLDTNLISSYRVSSDSIAFAKVTKEYESAKETWDRLKNSTQKKEEKGFRGGFLSKLFN